MKASIFVGASALILVANTAHAQSLEESYANLCSDNSSKQNETCTALRKAMLQKLNAEDGGQPVSNSSSDASLNSNMLVRPPLPGQPTTKTASSLSVSPRLDLMASLASNQTPLDPRWGILTRLVNTYWASENYSDQSVPQPIKVFRSYIAVTYLDGGQAVEIESDIDLNNGSPGRIFTLRPTSTPGVFNGEIRQPAANGKWNVKFRADGQGSVVSDWYKVADGLSEGSPAFFGRTGIRLMPNGSLAIRAAMGRGDNRPELSNPDDPSQKAYLLKPYDETAMQVMMAEQVASYQEWLQTYRADDLAMQRQMQQFVDSSNARRAQQEQDRLARKKSGGGLFGAFLGAAVGLYAGKVAGFNTEKTVGAMMKGMSFTNPNSPLANTLSSTGDQLLGGRNSGSAIGGINNVGGSSYPTKANMAIGACSGFSEANYRTKALEGGGDTQLNTMCGQAFEYYTMYKRAIAQGYSEADANRTYAAHEQSAQVASGYRSSHSAN